jgi:NADPH:quinone reductase-like Zn-dependent oxidoreductase
VQKWGQAMKAVRMHAFGGTDVLDVDDVAIPPVREDEVLVRVHAASVNPVDYKIRSGKYPAFSAEQLPRVLGRDIAGRIEQCGSDASAYWRRGDEVYAMLDAAHGGYVEYVAFSAKLCARKPRNLSFTEAAAVPLAALTAWQGLFAFGELRAGQTVLIHGGAGGVGHFAIQMAKAKGAEVITSVSHRDVDFVRSLGADRVIAYETERFEDRTSEVDLVFDLVGGQTRARSYAVIKRGGALISTLGRPDEDKARTLGIRVAGYLVKPSAEDLTEITRLIEQEALRPHIQATFAFEEARRAQAHLESEHSQGKVVLDFHV